MKRSRRSAKAGTWSAIVVAALASSSFDRAREARLLALVIESVAPRLCARLDDDRRRADTERRRLLDELARIAKVLSALGPLHEGGAD
ncbi:MAG: hypothetical protein ACKPBU_13995 [Alphaproteobacteria bacterium]